MEATKITSSHIFSYGERVQLTDTKGRMYTITLTKGAQWHMHKGWINHDEIVGNSEGSILETNTGLKFQAFKPLLMDYTLSMPRGATIIYPKDAMAIIGLADIQPGHKVLEAGAGSGAMSLWILRAISESGQLDSFEIRAEFAQIASDTVKNFDSSKGLTSKRTNWNLQVGDIKAIKFANDYDRAILDMLDPWDAIDAVASALRPGGVLAIYVATATQIQKTISSIKKSNKFAEPETIELIVRNWHHEGLAVRPVHRMIGHTGFITVVRRLALDAKPLPRRRRPGKGEDSEISGSIETDNESEMF
jgi:tRNA (adenine57-N1/adenine58-N1)-methyltransferase